MTDLLARFIRSAEDSSRLFTIAYLFAESEETLQQLDEAFPSRPFDMATVSRVLKMATADEISQLLWSRVGSAMHEEMFRSCFFATLAQADDEAIVWRLCGAASDYLRAHRTAFSIPREHALRLLQSTDPDRRVIGLKSCRYSDLSPHEQMQHIIAAINGDAEPEVCGGLYQLGVWMEDWPSFRPPEDVAAELKRALVTVAQSGETDLVRDYATRRIEMLEHYSIIPRGMQ